ncbi:hypothetical protein JI667_18980 [Bacillus sp. NTK074B]|uniref:hypothetical protein n=1 Tax=Bacillus sp. NTK074B TaxID=2802174 RepID=UPI001A8DF391|nr:hypothetical protein [Bacillus sp. NTK074B]
MNKSVFYENTRKRINWDILQERALSTEVLDKVIKFHQSGSFFRSKKMESTFISHDIMSWLEKVEYTDILPDVFEEEIKFDVDPTLNEGSTYDYDLNYLYQGQDIIQTMHKAFGRGENSTSKRYPSAGGLYPVIPLLFVFKENIVEDIPVPGVYMFNPYTSSIYRIKSFTETTLKDLKVAICLEEDFVSNVAIAYSIDLRRSVTKYRARGYRHSLIEVGLMAQSFRESLLEENVGMGDLCWSGFNDNALTHMAGLNVRLAPITLLQWFGKANLG